MLLLHSLGPLPGLVPPPLVDLSLVHLQSFREFVNLLSGPHEVLLEFISQDGKVPLSFPLPLSLHDYLDLLLVESTAVTAAALLMLAAVFAFLDQLLEGGEGGGRGEVGTDALVQLGGVGTRNF